MNSTLPTLKSRLAALVLKADTERAVAQCHDLVCELPPAIYRNPSTGETWNGHGTRPRWMDAPEAEEYRVHHE
jgi:DNA-binding protein H-NS